MNETKQNKETIQMPGPGTVIYSDPNRFDNLEVRILKEKIKIYEDLLKSSKKAYWNNPPAPGWGEVSLCQPSGENWPDDARLLVINVSNTDLDF